MVEPAEGPFFPEPANGLLTTRRWCFSSGIRIFKKYNHMYDSSTWDGSIDFHLKMRSSLSIRFFSFYKYESNFSNLGYKIKKCTFYRGCGCIAKKNIKLLDPIGGPQNDTILTIVDCAKKNHETKPWNLVYKVNYCNNRNWSQWRIFEWYSYYLRLCAKKKKLHPDIWCKKLITVITIIVRGPPN